MGHRQAFVFACASLVAAFVTTAASGAVRTAAATNPTVTITAPAEGASVSGNAAITISWVDDLPLDTLTVSLDGAPVVTTRAGNWEGGGIPLPFTASFDSAAYANGTHVVTATGIDTGGRSGTALVDLVFANRDLVASYAFEDGSGTILRDGSGSSPTHFGVLHGGLDATGWTTGHTGKGLSFDGVDDNVTIDSLKTFYANGFTLEAWVRKASSRGDEAIVGSWLSDGGGGPMLWVDAAGRYRLTIGSSFSLYLDSGHAAAVGTWEHVAGTWDGTTARIYVNGVEAASEPVAPSQIGGSSAWKIGSYGNAAGFLDGVVDEVRIYRRALTTAEILTDMAPPDTTPPTVPGSLALTGSAPTTLSVSWSASTDDMGVKLYDLYLDGTKIATTTGTSYVFVDLTCDTSYRLAVAAEDATGNVSAPATLQAPTAACPPPASLLADYSFPEGSGTSVGDGSGNGRAATMAGGASWTAGKIGGGLALNGIDGRVELPDFGTFYKSGFTLEAWVKKSSTSGDAAIVGTWNGAKGGGPMLWVDGAGRYALTLASGSSSYLFSGRAAVPGQWQHVAGTWDGATASIYVDGVLAASESFTGNPGDSTSWRIGAYGAKLFGAFDGGIDEVRIYSNALSAAQIATDMTSGPPVVDLTPPTAPSAFAAAGVTANTITTMWQSSTDDVGVWRYELYRNGVFDGLSSTPSYTFVAVPCGTAQSLTVRAVDRAGHESAPATTTSSTAACDTTTGLVARYGFDEAAGTSSADASGNGNTATLAGASFGIGRTGNGVFFDGTGARADLPSLGTFYKSGFTLEGWVRRSSASSEAAIVGSWTWDGNGGPMLWIDHLDHHLRLTLGRDLPNYLDGGVGIPVGEWHHVAATYDGTIASLYLDGSLVASSAFAGDVGDSSTWRIGAYGATPTGFYGGTIDDVRIYDRALGADQIASTMQG